jgi:hypothetical protein
MNNTGIYDAVLAGVAGSTQSLESGKSSLANFAAFGTAAQQLAVEVDNLIPPIVGGVQPNHITLMSSIVSGLEFNRYMKTGEFTPATIAVSVVQLFNTIFPLLTTVPVVSNFKVTLPDGSTFFATGMKVAPGVIKDGTEAAFYNGKETLVDVALNADPAQAVLVQDLTGFLANSTNYSCTLQAEVRIWETADPSHSASMNTNVDLYISINGAGVPTVTVQTTPYIDDSRLTVLLNTADMNVTAAVHGFAIWAQRPPGLACKCSASWWVTKFKVVA